MPLSAGDKLGHYEVLSLLGQGGMGEVYRARDTTLQRDVALKVLPATFLRDPERMARFQREAQVLASLDHPNIGHIHGIVDSEDSRGLVLALIEGPTLADRIAAGPIPQDEAIAVAKQIIEALEYAHDRGVVHRDLKPANIKITPEGVVKVLDFGLAKVLEDEPPASSLTNSPTLTVGHTRAGVILGTAAYMSPEQAVGRTVDRRSDIFSFGAVLYEMLTAKRAFLGAATPDVLESVVRNDPDWSALPPGTPVHLRKLLERTLAKDRKQRLQAIGEARIVLENPVIENSARPFASQSRFGIAGWFAAAVLGLAAVVFAVLYFRGIPQPPRTQRYSIPVPENANDISSLAISPDGRVLAIAATVNGKLQLWLRPLDSLQFQPLPGTDGAALPFWSPDSRYIGFAAQGKLRKIAASGGPAQTLCDAPAAFGGGSWSRDDVIVFSAFDTVKSIQKVPASGGTPVRVTGNLDSRYPAFLPDGRRFLYSVTQAAAQQQGIYVGSLDGTDNRRILADRGTAVFATSTPGGSAGYLLFLRENALMAQPFDASAARVSGEAFPIADGININGRFAPVAVSSNGTLLYWTGGVSARGTGGGFDVVVYDRAGKVLSHFVPGNVPAKMDVRGPSFSPDGKTVAYLRTGSDIWLYDLARGTDRRFTSDSASSTFPVWSPQGDRIVFRSNRNASAGDLYVQPLNGSGQAQLLLANPNDKIAYQWTRDGLIVYSEADPKTGRDLGVLQASKGASAASEIWKPVPYLQTQFNEFQGQLSPDSNWMAYTSDESGQREIYVRPFPASQGGVWKISTAGGAQPRWRGDGNELYYVAADGKMAVVRVKAAAGPKPSFEPRTPEPLFDPHIALNTGGHFFNYDVSADGARFVVIAAPSSDSAAPPPLTLLLNWNAGLK